MMNKLEPDISEVQRMKKMDKDNDLTRLAGLVRDLFQAEMGDFQADDFVAVAGLLGFDAHQKTTSKRSLKPVAEHCLPDIIGTNLQYSLDAYVWETHLPMREDGVIVSGFWENKVGAVLPEGLRKFLPFPLSGIKIRMPPGD